MAFSSLRSLESIITAFSSRLLTMHGLASYLGSYGKAVFPPKDWASLKSPSNQ